MGRMIPSLIVNSPNEGTLKSSQTLYTRAKMNGTERSFPLLFSYSITSPRRANLDACPQASTVHKMHAPLNADPMMQMLCLSGYSLEKGYLTGWLVEIVQVVYTYCILLYLLFSVHRILQSALSAQIVE